MTAAAGAQLVLVRHSLPALDWELSAPEWTLSASGRARCRPLAKQLQPYEPEALVTSSEPKAAETAQLLGRHLGLAAELDDRLREHDRAGVGRLEAPEWERAIAEVFARPQEVVLGAESLDVARRRFAGAIDERLAQVGGTLVAVTHGTVMCAFAAERAGVDGLALWRSLDLPAFLVLGRPGLSLEHVQASIV